MPGAVFRCGDRVTLRTVERDDAEFVHRGHNHPEVGVSLGVNRPESEAEAEASIEDDEGDPLNVRLLVCIEDDRTPESRDDGAEASDESADADDSTPIGQVYLKDLHHTRPEISYWILSEYQGDGYGTEAAEVLVDYAFESHEIRGLQAQAFAPNDGSVGVLENLGFTREGTLRDARFRDVRKSQRDFRSPSEARSASEDGEYVDVVWYGLLREEWEDD